MNKVYIKKILSLFIALSILLPATVLAGTVGASESIKHVYFEDEKGNMVFVDYLKAIRDSMEGKGTLYNAIKKYVGDTEESGRDLYLETVNGKILDYAMAMRDNLFMLKDILKDGGYEVDYEIKATHKLVVIDGVAEIVEIKDEVGSKYEILIAGPRELKVDEPGHYKFRVYGDGKGNKDYKAVLKYKIEGGPGLLEYREGAKWKEIPLAGYMGSKTGFLLTPDYNVEKEIRFTPSVGADYYVEILLIDLDENKVLADIEYEINVDEDGKVPPEDPIYIIGITPVNPIQVELGTSEKEAISSLPRETTIEDSEGKTHQVVLSWTIKDYKGDEPGTYLAIGKFELPEGIENKEELDLKVETNVIVLEGEEEDWPKEVEDVFLGESQITRNIYANIEIKGEDISEVEGVYLDDVLATNMLERPSQWRIKVEEGTTKEDLMGRIFVELKRPEIVYAEFHGDSLLEEGFGLGSLTVYIDSPRKYKEVTEYRVEYTVGNSDTTVLTDRAKLGESPLDLIQYLEGINKINIRLYDSHGREIDVIKDIMNR